MPAVTQRYSGGEGQDKGATQALLWEKGRIRGAALPQRRKVGGLTQSSPGGRGGSTGVAKKSGTNAENCKNNQYGGGGGSSLTWYLKLNNVFVDSLVLLLPHLFPHKC